MPTSPTPNNVANVSTTRGVAGGYLFRLPSTTNLDDDTFTLTTSLPEGTVNLGFISADGITEAESADTSTETDMNGDAVYTTRSNRVETERFRLLEVKADVLKLIHGDTNVTDASGILKAKHNNAERGNAPYVAELVLKDGRRWRKLIPAGQITEVADLTLNSSTLWGRDLTMTCNLGTGGNSVIDIYESTETHA